MLTHLPLVQKILIGSFFGLVLSALAFLGAQTETSLTMFTRLVWSPLADAAIRFGDVFRSETQFQSYLLITPVAMGAIAGVLSAMLSPVLQAVRYNPEMKSFRLYMI